jgi:hypothetical protein
MRRGTSGGIPHCRAVRMRCRLARLHPAAPLARTSLPSSAGTPAEDNVLALTAWADYLPTASCSSTWCAMRIFSGLTSNTGRVVPSSTFSAMFPRTNL